MKTLSKTQILKAALGIIAVVLTIAANNAPAADPSKNGNVSAQPGGVSAELARKITATIDADTKRLTEIFKDLHANPELGICTLAWSSRGAASGDEQYSVRPAPGPWGRWG